MKLWKAHGLGNDYLVLESPEALTPKLVRAICDRHRGVGADGILAPFDAGSSADYGVTIWNPDGSIAEKSGNGLRIFARWLHRERGAAATFLVSTGACVVRCNATHTAVSVEMGAPTFEPSEVPVLADSALIDAPFALTADETLRVTTVGMGNPHCVVFREERDLDSLPWRRWGQLLEVHPRFPNRTNVQIARVVGPSEVEIRIHERGAGETQASGSSSCAVAAAGVRTGRLTPGRIRVRMPGGELFITVGEGSVLLEGPVEGVCRCEVDADWLLARAE